MTSATLKDRSEIGNSQADELYSDIKTGKNVLEMRGITKKFPGVLANDDVDLDIKSGEIHVLLGENGAGKTTLMNVLYGLFSKDKGEIRLLGNEIDIDSPQEALNYGIGMVHQHRRLIDNHTALENIRLGNPRNKMILNPERVKREVSEFMDKWDFGIDLDAKIWELTEAEKQIVEILKVLYRGAKILILDEPTSALTPVETDRFLNAVSDHVGKDLVSAVLITHKLPVALKAGNRGTVLRNGKVVKNFDPKTTSRNELAKMMVGEEVLFEVDKKKDREFGNEILKVEEVSALNDRGVKTVNNVSFSIKEGEILGIAGVSGNGQQELAEVLMGLRKPTNGKIIFTGENITDASVRERWKKEISYIPSDRVNVGTVRDYSLIKNMALSLYFDEKFSSKGLLKMDKLREITKEVVKEFDIEASSVDSKAGHLSGGNLQRLILARALAQRAKLLIANLPTRGLDVGAIEFVQDRIVELSEQGTAVLLISEDLDQTLMLSDRVAPIYEGRLVDILSAEEADKKKVGAMMAGKEGRFK